MTSTGLNQLGTESKLQDTPVDIKLKLSALWIATMFVYAYVDIFALLRADYLEGLLAGEIVGTPFKVTQGFLVFTVAYIVPGSLMVYFSVALSSALNRRVNIGVAGIYLVTVAGSCIGEDWIYYLLGSAIEIVLFAMIIRLAWRWPLQNAA